MNFDFVFFILNLDDLFFRETREKINITWHPNGTVSYYQVKRWFYEPELTKGSLDDLITTLNIPFVVRFYSFTIMLCMMFLIFFPCVFFFLQFFF